MEEERKDGVLHLQTLGSWTQVMSIGASVFIPWLAHWSVQLLGDPQLPHTILSAARLNKTSTHQFNIRREPVTVYLLLINRSMSSLKGRSELLILNAFTVSIFP